MLIDADEFFAEAAAEEQHVIEMERETWFLLEEFFKTLFKGLGDYFLFFGGFLSKSKERLNVVQRRVTWKKK